MSKGTIAAAIILALFAGALMSPSFGGPSLSAHSASWGIVLVFACMAFFLYFLPSVIASNRAHPQASAIAVVNLFLGWTLIGWVISLAWAVSASRKPA